MGLFICQGNLIVILCGVFYTLSMKLDFHDVWRLPFLVIKMRLKTLYIFLPSIMFDFNKKFGFCRPLGQPFEVPRI